MKRLSSCETALWKMLGSNKRLETQDIFIKSKSLCSWKMAWAVSTANIYSVEEFAVCDLELGRQRPTKCRLPKKGSMFSVSTFWAQTSRYIPRRLNFVAVLPCPTSSLLTRIHIYNQFVFSQEEGTSFSLTFWKFTTIVSFMLNFSLPARQTIVCGLTLTLSSVLFRRINGKFVWEPAADSGDDACESFLKEFETSRRMHFCAVSASLSTLRPKCRLWFWRES